MTAKERFLKATTDWYRYVNLDHHKDRDCHWYIGIERKFSYGEDTSLWIWTARHSGYVADDLWFEHETESGVFDQVSDFIETYIKEHPPKKD